MLLSGHRVGSRARSRLGQSSINVLLVLALLGMTGYAGWRYFGPHQALAAGGWTDNWDRAIESSRQTGRPTLVLFTADWCPACKDFEGEVLSRPHVAASLRSRFTLVRVDLTDRGGEQSARAMKYGVQVIPTLIRYDTSGTEVARTHGMPADALLQWAAR